MGLFKKRAPSGVPKEVADLPWVKDPAPIDDDFGDPTPDAVFAALRSDDWVTARNTLLGAPSTVTSWSIGSRLFQDDPPVAGAERWVAEAPDDGLGHLVLGSTLIAWAWEARGGGYASNVEENAWDLFFSRLQRAEPELMKASQLLPDSVDPWNHLIWSGIGLQIPFEELTARFDEGHRRSRFHPQLVWSTLQMLCAKWYGTHEQMFAFARMVATEAAEGSPAISALAMAHVELVLNQARDMPLPDACKSMEGPEVRDELLAAAERSIFHPSFVPDAFGLSAANKFLVAFYQGSHDREAQRVIDLLRGRYCSSPFDYFGDAGGMCRKAEILTAKALGRRF